MDEITEHSLNILHEGIDVGNRIATLTHDFYEKLCATEVLMAQLHFSHTEHEEIAEFFAGVGFEIADLKEELEKHEGEIHVIVDQENQDYSLKHLTKVKDEIKSEREVTKELIEIIHKSFTTIKKDHGELEDIPNVQEIKDILEKLMQYIHTYENIFRELLQKL